MPQRSSTAFDYLERINRAVDHLYTHLAEAPSLAQLAKIAAFSPFHFHRVFRSVTGQPVARFQARLRVERAALLLGRANSRRRLTDVASEVGFSSSAELSRAFRARFLVSPSTFRAQKSKHAQTSPRRPRYLSRHAPASSIQLTSYPERRVAIIRVVDCFTGSRLATAHGALEAWADQRGLGALPLFGISHDDPEITPADQCRYDLGIEVDGPVRGSNGVITRALPAGEYLECRAHGGVEAITAAWEHLFTALPDSGFEPANAPGIERYLTKPDFASWSSFEAVAALPVVRLR